MVERKLAASALSLVVAVVLIVLGAAPVLASGPNGWIKGYVTDRDSGLPVAGAFIRIEPNGLPWVYELFTDGNGYFEVSAVPQVYMFIVLQSDYLFFQVQIGVGSLQTTWMNVSLDAAPPRTAFVQGYATDSSTGDPVTVGRLVAVPSAPPFQYINVSYFDGTGYYTLGLLPGDYNVFTDNVSGYFGYATSVSLADGQVLPLNLSLTPNPSNSNISGTAYDVSTLTPLAGATVSIDVDDLFLPSVITNASGGYSISVPSGSATVTGNMVGYGPNTTSVIVSPSSNYSVDLYLRPILGLIRGYVTDASNGSPVPNATVSAADSLGYYEQVLSDAGGYYEIRVPEQSFSVQASASGYFPYFTGFNVSQGETVWSNITLVPMPPIVATVQGYVVDASTGNHVGSAPVFCFDFLTGFFNSTIADSAGFYSLGVVESPFLQVIVPSGGGYAGGGTFTSADAGQTVWANLTIYPLNATVRLRVSDGLTGLPISGASVVLSWGFTYSTLNSTDANGESDLLSPATSDVNVNAFSPGYYSEFRTITVGPGLNPLDIALYPVLPFDVLVEGYITENGTGIPLAGAQVVTSGYPYSTVFAGTDAAGYYNMSVVAAPQVVRATAPQHVANETEVSPNPGDTIWVNMTLDYDPTPPEFASFTATPSVGVNSANPTSLVADILERSLDLDNTAMSLLRMTNSSGSTGTFALIRQVDPADLAITQPGVGEYTVSTMWDAVVPGGWIQNGTATEWWPVLPSPVPFLYALSGLWENETTSGFMGAFFDQTSGDLLFIANETLIIPPGDQPDSTFTPATMGLEIDLSSGAILGGMPIFGSSYRLAGLRFVYDERVPSGTYGAFLQATDTGGNSNFSAVLFDVDAVSPVANAGADKAVDEDTIVTFDGSGSSDNVGVANYTWTFTDGAARTVYGATPTYTFARPGVYVVTLTVRDAGGNQGTDSMKVTVRDVTAPTASAGLDRTVDEDATVSLDGSGSTDNVGVANYTWTFTDGTSRTLYGSSPSFVFQTPGLYTITLTVRDAAGNSATDTMVVTVRDVTSPTASIDSPASGATVSGSATITATAGDNVAIVRVELRVDSTLAATDTSAPYSFSLDTRNYSDGSHTIRITAYDEAGNSAFAERTLTFSNPAPAQGLGLVEYGIIILVVIVAAVLLAAILFSRRRGRPPVEAPSAQKAGRPEESEAEPSESREEL